MTIQSCITFGLVALAAGYFFRGSLKSALGKGCASGCGSCKACPAAKLKAIQKELEAKP